MGGAGRGGTNALALSFLEPERPRKAIAGEEKGLRANVTPRWRGTCIGCYCSSARAVNSQQVFFVPEATNSRLVIT